MDTPEAFLKIVERAGREKGTPLPAKMLTVGEDDGWQFDLNPTDNSIDKLPPYTARVRHRGTPVGIIGLFGGIALGGVDDKGQSAEDALIQWCDSDLVAC